jgi:AraC-like DNA-binding protein
MRLDRHTVAADESKVMFEFVRVCQLSVLSCASEHDGATQLRACWTAIDACPRGAGSGQPVIVSIVEEFARHIVGHKSHACRPFASCTAIKPGEIRVAEAVRRLRTSHCRPTLSLRSLSRELGITGAHLSRLLTKHTGSGFLTNLQRLRLLTSVLAMNDVRLRMKEIAVQSGFATTSEFDRRFRQTFQMTPSDFRACMFALDRQGANQQTANPVAVSRVGGSERRSPALSSR